MVSTKHSGEWSQGEKEKSCMGSNYAELAAFLWSMVQAEREVPFLGETTRASVFLKAEDSL